MQLLMKTRCHNTALNIKSKNVVVHNIDVDKE